jgi:acetylglutamate kinase
VGAGPSGETFNINADLVAAKVAAALSAGRLIFITDVDGLMDTTGQLVSTVDKTRAEQMIADQSISGGMIPKVECALAALEQGIEKVQVINGKRRHALLLELFTDKGIGTEVIP